MCVSGGRVLVFALLFLQKIKKNAREYLASGAVHQFSEVRAYLVMEASFLLYIMNSVSCFILPTLSFSVSFR